MSGGQFISLPTFVLRKKKVRYLHFSEDMQVEFTERDLPIGTPLFLASDILSGASITPDNQPRIHARYGKLGLATKLTFPSGTKVSGLHGVSRGVWFYSVQGAVKVTFEFHPPDQQVAMMDSLQDLWRMKCSDPPLPLSIVVPKITVTRNRNIEIDTAPLQIRGNQVICENGTDLLSPLGNAGTLPETLKKVPSQKREYTVIVESDVPLRKRMLEDKEKSVDETSEKDGDGKKNFIQKGNGADLLVHHIEEVSTDEEPVFSSLSRSKCWCDVLRTGAEKSGVGSNNENTMSQQLITACKTFATKVCTMTSVEIETLTGLLNSISNRPIPPTTRDLGTPECGQISDSIISAVAEWLGTKFHGEVCAISRKVQEFKLRNIDQINSLPHPRVLVQTLFPQPMVDLLLRWMGLQSIGAVTVSPTNAESYLDDCHKQKGASCSKDGTGPHKAVGEEEQPEGIQGLNCETCYPLVQFILELANQTLISGMAHVIYPRLIQNASI